MNKIPRLSVIIITKNEAHCIRRCLESVRWADEIIVLDSGSSDETVAICREYTTHVFETDWPGYGVQKNRALNHASGDWILSLDADEQVSQELQTEIQHAIQSTTYTAWQMPRLSSYCGRFMRHGGWWPDWVLRLFKQNGAKFTTDLVHEHIEVLQGKTGRLNSPLIHYSYLNLEEVLNKVNSYSSAGAQVYLQKGKKVRLRTAILHGLWTFLRTYFIRLGFLDGREGFMLAVSNAETSYYRYIKLMYLREKQESQPTQ